MKRIKRLLVMLCVIILGMTAAPARAEVIEVDKPAEPKEVTVQEVKLDKAVYRVEDRLFLWIKFMVLGISVYLKLIPFSFKGQVLCMH